MSNYRSAHRSDVLILGGGIVGLTHARRARALGLSVTLIERSSTPVGASIRNFGHLCFSAQDDAMQPLAKLSRAGWQHTIEDLGLWHQHRATLAVARTEPEMTLLKNLESRRPGVQVLDQTAVQRELDGLGGGLFGGAVLLDDIRVDPRQAVPALAEAAAAEGVECHFRTSAHDISKRRDGIHVTTSRGAFVADRVFVCVGHDLDHVFGDLADEAGVQRCRLNMVRIALPNQHRVRPAVLTTTSMARYGAFTETPGIDDVRADLSRRAPQLLDIVANVMCVQLRDGTWLVGDSHHYGLDAPPFQQESHTLAILDELRDVLGISTFAVTERWQGVYAQSDQQVVLRREPIPGVHVVSVTSGIGMTLSHGIAYESFADDQPAG